MGMADIRDMRHFMDTNELEELRSMGAYYSWTNKTVYSRIDRALVNVYWHEAFSFTQVRYDNQSLSDHTNLLIKFPDSPREKTRFQFCDMWTKHQQFESIILASLPSAPYSLKKLKLFKDRIRPRLWELNKAHFQDLREQQEISRCHLQQLQKELETNPSDENLKCKEYDFRCKYNNILSSSISLLQQQCKQE